MKLYKIKDKISGLRYNVSCQHFGYDEGVKRVRWHGLYEVEARAFPEYRTFKSLDRLHRWCIRLPWCAGFNKELYERV